MNSVSIFHKKYMLTNIIVSLAIITSTFTQLRFSGLPVGVSDIFMMLYIGIALVSVRFIGMDNGKKDVNYQLKEAVLPLLLFLLLFYILLVIGTLYAAVMMVDVGLSPYHNLVAFFYLLLIFLALYVSADIDINLVFIYISYGLAFLVSFLLIISFFSRDIAGINLYYLWTDRLMLFTRSPNHLADFIAPLPFILLFLIKYNKDIMQNKLFIIIGLTLVLFLIIAGLKSSSKATISGWFLAFIYLTYFYITTSKYKHYIYFISFAVIFFGFVIYSQYLHDLVYIWTYKTMQNSSNVSLNHAILYDIHIRVGLLGNAMELANLSPFFGFGAGASSGITDVMQGREAHNNFADIAMMSGYIGLFLYLSLLFFIASRIALSGQPLLMAAFIVINVTTLFHFQLRQPIFWFYLLFVLYATNSIKPTRE